MMRKFGFDTMFVLVQWFLKIWKGWINWQKFSPVCDWVFRFSYCDCAFRWKVGDSGRAKKKQQPKNCLKAFQSVRHFGCCTCACDLRQRHREMLKCADRLTVTSSRDDHRFENYGICLVQPLRTYKCPIRPGYLPPNILHNFCFSFLLGIAADVQEKLRTMKNFGVKQGAFWEMCKWRSGSETQAVADRRLAGTE